MPIQQLSVASELLPRRRTASTALQTRKITFITKYPLKEKKIDRCTGAFVEVVGV